MPGLEWSDSFHLGVPSIDAQHRNLVDLINDLYAVRANGEGRDALLRVLNRLVDYTFDHFQHEEDMLRRFEYPEFDGHSRKHESLRERVRGLKQGFDLGESNVEGRLFGLLKEWLVTHILEEDRRYVPWLIERGAE